MELKFHQVDLLCRDARESAQAYRLQFSLGEIPAQARYDQVRDQDENMHRGVKLHFMEKPPRPNQAYPPEVKYGIYSLSYLCQDLEETCDFMHARGVRLAWEEGTRKSKRSCTFYDADGLLFRILEEAPSTLAVAVEETRPLHQSKLQLHHVSILTPDLRRAQRFYEQNLGLKTVFEFLLQEGGFVFLADAWFDHRTHPFLLEIIGPPHLEAREEAILSARGACYDHVCYITTQIDAAWRWAVEHGAKPVAPPYRYEGTRMAWLKDAQGVDIEIMAPIPRFVLDYALRTGKPLNGKRKWQTARALAGYAWQSMWSGEKGI